MEHIPQMADLGYTDEEKAEKAKNYGPTADGAAPVYSGSDYPYGLSICLSERELKLSGVDGRAINVGDTIHGHFFAKVTSVNADAKIGDDGADRRVEMTITSLSSEDESTENQDEDARDDGKGILDKMYG